MQTGVVRAGCFFILIGLSAVVLPAVAVEGEESSLVPGIALPPVEISTNDAGTVETRFSTLPVVTNMAVATNQLAALEERMAAAKAEFEKLAIRERPLRSAVRENYFLIKSYSTNYVPVDVEGKKLKKRISDLESELKELREQLEKKMSEDPGYQKARDKDSADRKEWLEIQKRKSELSKERSEVSAQFSQVRKALDREAGSTPAVEPETPVSEQP